MKQNLIVASASKYKVKIKNYPSLWGYFLMNFGVILGFKLNVRFETFCIKFWESSNYNFSFTLLQAHISVSKKLLFSSSRIAENKL